jgi:hypothetical protein
MSNTGDLAGGIPIAVWSQYISDVSAVNPLDAFYDIHGRKGEVLCFWSVSNTTRSANRTIITPRGNSFYIIR